MIPQTDSEHIDRVDVFRLFVISLALFSVMCLCPPGLIAESASQSDPFDVEVSPAFSEVAKALGIDDYDQALKLLSELRSNALKARSKSFQREVLAETKEVNRLKREFARVRKYSETLKKNSDDPKANEVIGKFYCVEKGDWGRGLVLLSKSEEPQVQQTVHDDLKRPAGSSEQVKLADRWWRLAAKEKGRIQKAYLLRGRYWFLQARSDLTSAERVDREKQLKRISLKADRIIIWNQHNGEAADRGTVECVVTLLYEGKSVWRQVVRMPWEPDSPAGRVLRTPKVRFDLVRVDVTKFRGKGGGLGEIEVFDGRINVARDCSAKAKGYWELNRQFHPNKVTDGNKTGRSGYWLLNNGRKGWVAIDLVTSQQQQ